MCADSSPFQKQGQALGHILGGSETWVYYVSNQALDTRIELIPVQGGETRDAMFIHLPDLGVLFVGDFIMPYLGAPSSSM